MRQKLMIVYAHPDDESFSIGGTLAKYKDRKIDIRLICATRGEAGSAGNPPICLPWEIGEARTRELKAAAKILGIGKIYFPGMRDGTLARFSTPFLSSIIQPILEYEKPEVIVSFAETGISGHEDHIAISQGATDAVKKYLKKAQQKIKYYHSTIPQSVVAEMRAKGLVRQIFNRPFAGTPDEKITTVIDIKSTYQTKIKALKCHRTQHQDWERFLKRIELGISSFAMSEYYVLQSTNFAMPKDKETDLFQGL